MSGTGGGETNMWPQFALLLLGVVMAMSAATTIDFTNNCDRAVNLYDGAKLSPIGVGETTPREMSGRTSKCYRLGKGNQATLAEFAVDQAGMWFDISIIPTGALKGPGNCSSLQECRKVTGGTGFNAPMKITPKKSGAVVEAGSCRELTCFVDGCPDAYHFPNDTKTHHCTPDIDFEVTFCPERTSGSKNGSKATGFGTLRAALGSTGIVDNVDPTVFANPDRDSAVEKRPSSTTGSGSASSTVRIPSPSPSTTDSSRIAASTSGPGTSVGVVILAVLGATVAVALTAIFVLRYKARIISHWQLKHGPCPRGRTRGPIWTKLKACCTALRCAKNDKERDSAMTQVQDFMRDDARRFYVHKWRSWGLLLSSLLCVLKADAHAYLGVGGGAGAARKRKTKLTAGAKKKPPKIAYWNYLRTEFAAANAVDGPILHLDQSGRECLFQMVAFALAIIGREATPDVDTQAAARMEGEAWAIVQAVVKHRVYCAVFDQSQLQEVLELALTALDHGSLAGTDAIVRASIVHSVLKNCPYDLYDWLEKLVSYFGDWFDRIRPESTTSVYAEVAPTMLQALVDLSHIYFAAIGPLLLVNGVKILHYVQRNWRRTHVRLRSVQAEFIIQYWQLFNCNRSYLRHCTDVTTAKLARELKSLVTMLNPREYLQGLPSTKAVRSGGTAVNANGIAPNGPVLDFDEGLVAFFAAAADCIYYHDVLVTALRGEEADELIDHARTSESLKRRRSETALAWSELMDKLLEDTSASSVTGTPMPTARARFGSSNRSIGGAAASDVCWMILAMTVLRRHGADMWSEHFEDIKAIMKKVVAMLTQPEVDQRHAIGLHILVQLAHLSALDGNKDLVSELAWEQVWDALLRPDLPHARLLGRHAASDSYAESAMVLLGCCVSFDLVDRLVIKNSLTRLPFFHEPIIADSITSSFLSNAPVCLLTVLLRKVDLQLVKQARNASNDIVDEISGSQSNVDSRLVKYLISHLKMQSLKEAQTTASDVLPGMSSDVVALVYASSFLAYLRLPSHFNFSSAEIWSTPLLQRLSPHFRHRQQPSAFCGFGVPFILNEWGLEDMQMRWSSTLDSTEDAFLPSMADFVDQANTCDLYHQNNYDTAFKQVGIPSDLLDRLVPSRDRNVVGLDAGLAADSVPKLSVKTFQEQTHLVIEELDGLINEFTTRICATEGDPMRLVQLLVGVMDIGVAIAGMLAEIDASNTALISTTLSLLKRFLELVTSYVNAEMLVEALKKQLSSQSISLLLMKFHSFILLLQGKRTLSAMEHPVADSVDLRIPSELRVLIRKFVGTIDSFISSALMQDDDLPGVSRTAASPRDAHFSRSLSNSWDWDGGGFTISMTPSTQSSGLPKDPLDETRSARTLKGSASKISQTACYMWCLRVILLLKKEGGLKTIRSFDKRTRLLRFSPDCMLAIAAMVCGVSGCDSLDLVLELVDQAADEISKGRSTAENKNHATVSLFTSSILKLLKLCGLVYERRKRGHKEEVPDQLLQTARVFLESSTADMVKPHLRYSRKAEMECLEVFFRLNADMFEEFVEVVMPNIQDSDFMVRVASARSLQSLFYMYPDGGQQVFRDIYQSLTSLFPDPPVGEDHTKTVGSEVDATAVKCEICVSVVLALFVSACSSVDVVPEVLNVFVSLARSRVPTYFEHKLLFRCLCAISKFYGYEKVDDMVDDHFHVLWARHLGIGGPLFEGKMATSWAPVDKRQHVERLLKRFPLPELIGISENSRYTFFAGKLDTMFPLAVVFDGLRQAGRGDQFAFVNNLASLFLMIPTDEVTINLDHSMQQQQDRDLLAFFFLLQGSSDQDIQNLGSNLFALASKKLDAISLPVPRMGSIIAQMAQLVVWGVFGTVQNPIDDVWKNAWVCFRASFVEFKWSEVNVPELLAALYVLIVKNRHFEPGMLRGIECLCMISRDMQDELLTSIPLQQLLIHFGFQILKTSGVFCRPAARKLTLLLRQTCEFFIRSPDMFGKYMNFVVQQVASVFGTQYASADDKSGLLDAEARANLDWIIFAICNNMGSGLDKYIIHLDPVEKDLSTSLDKLNLLISSSHKVVKRSGSLSSSPGALPPANEPVRRLENLMKKINGTGDLFHQPSPHILTRSSHSDAARSAGYSTGAASSQSIRLQIALESIAKLRKEPFSASSVRTLATLARVLLYANATGYGDQTQFDCEQINEAAALADVLGEAGALDSNEYDLGLGGNMDELSMRYQQVFNRKPLRETKISFVAAMHERLLFCLCTVFFEEANVDPKPIQAAVLCLKRVLNTGDGLAVLSKFKDGDLKRYLESFVQSSASSWTACSAIIHQPDAQLTMTKQQHLKTWSSAGKLGFSKWICTLTAFLASASRDEIMSTCANLLQLRPDFAVFLFPYTVWNALRNPAVDARVTNVVQEGIQQILQCALPENDSSSANSPADAQAMQLLIHTINFMRETEKAEFVESNGRGTRATSKSVNNNTLNQLAYGCLVDIDFLDIAEAALKVKMPYSAMQYVEMWLEERYGGLHAAGTVQLNDRARSILIEAYSADNNIDGIYGVNDSRTFQSQLVTYNKESNYSKALPLYDASVQVLGAESELLSGMIATLGRLGYDHLLDCLVQGQGLTSSAPSSAMPKKYELAWKKMQWDGLDEQPLNQCSNDSILYQSLKALAHQDYDHLDELVRVSKCRSLRSVELSLYGMESTKDSHTALLELQCIRDIEKVGNLLSKRSVKSRVAEGMMSPIADDASNPNALLQLFDIWQRRLRQVGSDFDKVERILSLGDVLVQLTSISQKEDVLSRVYLSMASSSRKANRIALAYKALMKLEDLEKRGTLRVVDRLQGQMEKAKLLWSQHEARSAIWTAQQVRSEIVQLMELPERQRSASDSLLVSILTLTGKWLASERSESSQVIIEDYFGHATQVVEAMDVTDLSKRIDDAAKAHIALADYMTDMYQQVSTRVRSKEWLARRRVAEARQRELEECLAMNQAKQMENRVHIHTLNKEVKYDTEERMKVEESVDQFLNGALQSFGRGMSLSSRPELAAIFRVLSLWFSNHNKSSVNSVMQEHVIDAVPSYKFVPLSYQLMSRIGSSGVNQGNSSFEQALRSLVLKLCKDHPHHALVQLIALKNSADVEGKGALEFRTNVGDAKTESAKEYLEELRRTNQRELLESLDVLSNAYVQLALFDTREYHKLGKKIPLSKVPITTVFGGTSHHSVTFDQCMRDRTRRGNRAVMPAVLTCTIPPRADMDYSNVVCMSSFEPLFSITDSGIHRPKIIYCYGSDGRRYKQLVKGKDDTRQDLVIEQVFDTVNHFLAEDQNTRKRKLRLLTYKVVPLSPIAGVLEWVDNTMPWGSYLVGRSGKRISAHERYHPHEWKHVDARMALKNATNKFEAYQEIEANFTPVFHHFFLERFPDPAMWYQRRLAYIQSVAVTSIVGYILGIGDRHSQNILIHEETAELVHIDFGVVFDQGMALFTPETVPFRLTRDLVDGMGVSGVDGVFTRCCEATLQLLRKKSASVVTILEVFVHDPLYRWTLSPLKALRIQEEHTSNRRHVRQNGADESGSNSASQELGANNDAAARALIRVKQKLEGYEDPNGNALSIEGQVKQLISVARDQHNLCNLFPGWAPWL
ncbi:TPA: hypothetical protein N0F65_006595 [Lagenidium giganteum]|uniref:non-specific serine/threonine protein kinase n=1 Tax=Lagenidium giganteum TaxID=4803 RepID=A0AAV2ZA57_9STRA|nr:TPA: hypothetical protein N0F65_006595 [Lagenidium giganteum]